MQQQPRRRRRNQATHATDNVQQTADDMQEHASTCEMQEETHGIAVLRVRRAAGSGQGTSSSMREALFSTTSAQHGTDATHKMQHTTGAAAGSKHTRNRHYAAGIETYDETNGIRTLGLPGFLRSGFRITPEEGL